MDIEPEDSHGFPVVNMASRRMNFNFAHDLG